MSSSPSSAANEIRLAARGHNNVRQAVQRAPRPLQQLDVRNTRACAREPTSMPRCSRLERRAVCRQAPARSCVRSSASPRPCDGSLRTHRAVPSRRRQARTCARNRIDQVDVHVLLVRVGGGQQPPRAPAQHVVDGQRALGHCGCEQRRRAAVALPRILQAV